MAVLSERIGELSASPQSSLSFPYRLELLRNFINRPRVVEATDKNRYDPLKAMVLPAVLSIGLAAQGLIGYLNREQNLPKVEVAAFCMAAESRIPYPYRIINFRFTNIGNKDSNIYVGARNDKDQIKTLLIFYKLTRMQDRAVYKESRGVFSGVTDLDNREGYQVVVYSRTDSGQDYRTALVLATAEVKPGCVL